MRAAGGDTLRAKLYQARLDDDAAVAQTGVPISAAKDAANARAPSDPTAVEATRPDARRSSRPCRRGDDPAKKFPRTFTARPANTNTPKPQLELVVAHSSSKPTSDPMSKALRQAGGRGRCSRSERKSGEFLPTLFDQSPSSEIVSRKKKMCRQTFSRAQEALPLSCNPFSPFFPASPSKK